MISRNKEMDSKELQLSIVTLGHPAHTVPKTLLYLFVQLVTRLPKKNKDDLITLRLLISFWP
jgi:hypothetical protein